MFSVDQSGWEAPRRMVQSYARASRHSSQFFAVLVADLRGELEVSELGPRIESVIRVEDTALLVGPSRLLLLLEGHRHVSDPLRVAQRLLAELADHVSGIGIAADVRHYDSAASMHQAAVTALESVSEGTIRHANAELRREAEYRLQFEDELTAAIRERHLEPYFQPIIDLSNGRISGFEALVRWAHPTEGLLFPEHFLTIAKECALLPDLDRFILERSLQQLEIWQQQVDDPIRVNVNLCPEHFLQDGGVDRLATILDAHPAVKGMLRIDISEEVLLTESGVAALYSLQGMMVGFHLDDFNVSPESFRCLQSFPFDSLKIDRGLIAQMEDEVNAELIISVVRIAQRMKVRTTAEGLVTHAQLEELRQLGCNEAQGFLFSAAIDAAAAQQFLRDGPRW